jgi:hypothetical protein
MTRISKFCPKIMRPVFILNNCEIGFKTPIKVIFLVGIEKK